MKAAISIFVVFVAVAFFLMTRKPSSDMQTATLSELNGQSAILAMDSKNFTEIEWLDSVKHVGQVKSGEKVLLSYRFKNTGQKPLVVSNVIVSCGCTVAEKPEEPIAPGEEGVIKAEFNSTNRVGTNHKTITVHTNTTRPISTLSFDVDVVELTN